eukprot:COSAG06_NODE_1213_length_10240_cov_645.253525_7_plen_98_part_00
MRRQSPPQLRSDASPAGQPRAEPKPQHQRQQQRQPKRSSSPPQQGQQREQQGQVAAAAAAARESPRWISDAEAPRCMLCPPEKAFEFWKAGPASWTR